MFRMRLVSSNHCKFCASYRKILDDNKYDYDVFDGDNPSNAAQLDAWLISKFPVVQIVEVMDTTTVVKWQFPQGQTPEIRFINFKIAELEQKRKK